MKDSSGIFVAKTIWDMREFRAGLRGTVGLVPTMGFLHGGHLSLVELAKRECDFVVVSIFVNPKQFGPGEDFGVYPRDLDRDLGLLKKAKTDFVFLPAVEEMYPENFGTHVVVENISDKLEGKSRPGHFVGVATVVCKLFHIIQPTNAYFGQKDAQQVVVIRKMVEDLVMPVRIVVGETVREEDGLAMSSRNVFLGDVERKEAGIIYRSLLLAKSLFENGERSSEKIKSEMIRLIGITSGVVDYVSIADINRLDELKNIENVALVSLAVRFGKTRLIDNIVLKK